MIILGLVALGIGGFFLYPRYNFSDLEDTTIRVSVRIESDEIQIGTKISGRVKWVGIEEGETIIKNQPLVRLENQELDAQLRGAVARINFSKQQELQARLQINAVRSQIEEVNLNLQQSQVDAQSQVAQAQSSVAVNIAQLNEA